ncbi:hypothetical protein BV20DRAFT_183669 [Pilatotrama ljubarskyi]|nr:hypothetical protein BV20DRAFT_183669 [Pilatotrama ljubarskyi]
MNSRPCRPASLTCSPSWSPRRTRCRFRHQYCTRHRPDRLAACQHRETRPPRLEIDPTLLELALDLRGPTALAEVLGCHPRTVRRRALEQGLVPPGPPVRTPVVQPDGSTAYVYTGRVRPVSSMTDAELDAAIPAILVTFPSFGRKMIQGHLRSQGHKIPSSRIRAACARLRQHEH